MTRSFLHKKQNKCIMSPYPDICRNMCGWCAEITTKPMGYVEIDNTEDEMPYQIDEMSQVVPITELEQIRGLVDEGLIDEVKPILVTNDPMIQDEENNYYLVQWESCDEAKMKDLFYKACGKRIIDIFGKIRKKATKPSWMGEKVYAYLLDGWQTEEFKKLSQQNKTNLASTRA
ncbi:hypothetical protein KIW84_073754 [Lathyrus oleraceus]|uniref:Uncharacterized protein n=1 Tax=Pisum sativum TaxID=3888 RepID=A0A9D4ZXS1_PEA|nr:hypothetical protein KIW84_073754 [Pisum sativum]